MISVDNLKEIAAGKVVVQETTTGFYSEFFSYDKDNPSAKISKTISMNGYNYQITIDPSHDYFQINPGFNFFLGFIPYFSPSLTKENNALNIITFNDGYRLDILYTK